MDTAVWQRNKGALAALISAPPFLRIYLRPFVISERREFEFR